MHYRRQVSLARRTAVAIARLWRQVDRTNLGPSWRSLVPQAVAILTGSQAFAAAASESYVSRALAEQGSDADPVGRVIPGRFAGTASDGRPLDSLLYQPAFTALKQLKSGSDVRRAMSAGLLDLDMIVRTQVADAGRVADGVAIAARPEVTGYVRMLSPPSCSRCAVLAGAVYRWNRGFKRHPRCDCRHIPAAEDAQDLTTDPKAYFDSLEETEQNRVFTKAGAEAIRDGADMARVVNARRGMYTAAGKKLTTEATTGRRARRGARLMPERIYREAGTDRAEAVRLLRLHGYLI